MKNPYILLHTADWHLGHSLYGASQKKEHELFLSWLLETIQKEKASALLIAGDIFDQANPPAYARKQYFDFLLAAKKAGLRQVFILSGNHDSPSDLDAPRKLLEELDITVISSLKTAEKKLIFSLDDEEKKPQAYLALLPYPREGELRSHVPGESFESREKKWQEALRKKYQNLLLEAQKKAKTHTPRLPIIGTGHLSLSAAKSSESEQKPYFQDLPESFIKDCLSKFDYFALGHFHRPQTVFLPHICYSGSPLAFSFSEASESKRLMKIMISENSKLEQESICIPEFRKLLSLSGEAKNIEEKLSQVKASKAGLASFIHLKLQNPPLANEPLHERLAKPETCEYEILKLTYEKSAEENESESFTESLSELSPSEVFSQLCQQKNIVKNKELEIAFKQILYETTLCEL